MAVLGIRHTSQSASPGRWQVRARAIVVAETVERIVQIARLADEWQAGSAVRRFCPRAVLP